MSILLLLSLSIIVAYALQEEILPWRRFQRLFPVFCICFDVVAFVLTEYNVSAGEFLSQPLMMFIAIVWPSFHLSIILLSIFISMRKIVHGEHTVGETSVESVDTASADSHFCMRIAYRFCCSCNRSKVKVHNSAIQGKYAHIIELQKAHEQ